MLQRDKLYNQALIRMEAAEREEAQAWNEWLNNRHDRAYWSEYQRACRKLARAREVMERARG